MPAEQYGCGVGEVSGDGVGVGRGQTFAELVAEGPPPHSFVGVTVH